MSVPHRVLSFGGGVQSHALLALLGQGRYPGDAPEEIWLCDPHNERPQTYAFIERVTKSYCTRLGVPFITLERHVSPSRGPDIREAYQRRAAYPLRSNRVCTVEWKVMARECKRRGWHREGGVEKHIGISLDELHRARTGQEQPWETKRYPLIEARLFRRDCIRLCQDEFGAVPVKSGCWWCKYQRPTQWREVWEHRADGRWQQAVDWERAVVARRGPPPACSSTRGHDARWSSGHRHGLAESNSPWISPRRRSVTVAIAWCRPMSCHRRKEHRCGRM